MENDSGPVRERLRQQLDALTTAGSDAYNNLIIAGGYIGLATLFQGASPFISASHSRWFLICLSASLALYVMWEILKRQLMSRFAFKIAAMLAQPDDQFWSEHERFRARVMNFNRRMLIPFWFVFPVTTGLGITATVILLAGLFSGL